MAPTLGAAELPPTATPGALVTCPMCNSAKVSKSLMAPRVTTGREKDSIAVASMDKTRQALMSEMRQLRDKITENAENVGEKFPEEARKIHYREVEPRSIVGEATAAEARELLEEGIEFQPLPILPEEQN